MQVDNGALTIGNGLNADNLRVGFTAGANVAGTLTVNGGAVVVGSNAGDLDVGRSTLAAGSIANGTLNLANAASVSFDVTNFRLGTMTAIPAVRDNCTVTLPAGVNTIRATNLILGDSPGSGNTAVTSTLTLGAGANNLFVDTFRIGAQKSRG